MFLLSRFRASRRKEASVPGECPVPQFLHRPPSLPQFEAMNSPPDSTNISLSQHYAQMAQDLRSSLPSTCRWFGPGDVNLVSERQIAAGGFADVYEATQGGRKVVLKSYRCYLSFDVTEVIAVGLFSLCRVYVDNSLAEVSQ